MKASSLLALVSTIIVVQAISLADVCTSEHVLASLPASGFYQGITINTASLSLNAVTNASARASNNYPAGTFDFCNVTYSYTHDGHNDTVLNTFWLPTPSSFKNRYLSTGGGGLAINSGTTTSGMLPAGIIYGSVAGITDGGFGGFGVQMDAKMLLAEGVLNWETVRMFGLEAHHEMSSLGKELTRNFFSMGETKLYSYYQGCSEGGREGWSQVQRFADEWDGAVTGAPAFRFSHQQIQHLYSAVVEQILGYAPPPCELQKVVNETITFCDPLDGKTDGVVSRTDLCKLKFNINSTIGLPYYCPATGASTGPPGLQKRQFPPMAPKPAQNGTVSAQAIAIASKIIDGLKDSRGKRAYLSYQPAASFADAATTYNTATLKWETQPSGLGSEFPVRFLELRNSSSFAPGEFANVTYDTLRDWMEEGLKMYNDTLQTTYPDLTPFHKAGGKVIHYHGESDDSIPTASSVRYYESVRSAMYPDLSFNESTKALGEWYRLFLVPGAGHCGPSTSQPNGPFPRTVLASLIDWVEKDVVPETLDATVLSGDFAGEQQEICAWPLRPVWTVDGTIMECVYDQESIDTWVYEFDAFEGIVY